MKPDLRDPEHCRCGGDSAVIESRPTQTHRWRRRRCLTCAHTWTTYESLINPAKVRDTPPNIEPTY